MKVAIYARVSSNNGTQDYQRQINDLSSYAAANNMVVEAVFAEKISGAKRNQDRQELMNMIDFVNGNNIEKVRFVFPLIAVFFAAVYGNGKLTNSLPP